MSALDAAPFTVGFAAETNDVKGNALKKLRGKDLDMICANSVGECGDGRPRGFDADDNELLVLTRDGETALERAPKAVLARELVSLIGERFAAAGRKDNACAQSS